MKQEKNILILGAGINGLALACVLTEAGLSVSVLDKSISSLLAPLPLVGEGLGERAVQGERRDKNLLRVSALTPSSLDFLEKLNIKKSLDHQSLSYFSGMKIWDNPNLDHLNPNLDLEAQGAIVENIFLQSCLKNQAEKLGVVFYTGEPVNLSRDSQKVYLEFKSLNPSLRRDDAVQRVGTLEADILIGADGVNSWVREAAGIKTQIKSYQELAIVAVLETSKNHEQTAYQKFIRTGPIAFLPLLNSPENSNLISLVWSCEKNKAQDLLNLSPEHFERELEKNFGILGALKLRSERVSFELKHHHAKRYISEKIVLIGDAAHSIHPLAGLGLNMGLKDVKVLAELLIRNKNRKYSWQILSSYERERVIQNSKIHTAMTGLDFIFKNKVPGLNFMREQGMSWINQSSYLKRKIVETGY